MIYNVIKYLIDEICSAVAQISCMRAALDVCHSAYKIYILSLSSDWWKRSSPLLEYATDRGLREVGYSHLSLVAETMLLFAKARETGNERRR